MWSHQDTDELQRLKDQLTLLQDSGVVFPEDSWPMRLLRSHPRCARPEPGCIVAPESLICGRNAMFTVKGSLTQGMSASAEVTDAGRLSDIAKHMTIAEQYCGKLVCLPYKSAVYSRCHLERYVS